MNRRATHCSATLNMLSPVLCRCTAALPRVLGAAPTPVASILVSNTSVGVRSVCSDTCDHPHHQRANATSSAADRFPSVAAAMANSSALTAPHATAASSSARPFSTEAGDDTEWPAKDLEDLLANNKQWAANIAKDDPSFFDELAKGQSPDYLWIGCSDSRVPANQLLGLGPGEVFVHRNIGGMCVNTDMNFLSVLQYAVQFLKVKHIIVCGHYDCGAVKASLNPEDLGLIDNWLRNIRDVARLHHDELFAEDISPTDRVSRLVELTVMENVLSVFKTGVVQKERLRSYKERKGAYVVPRVHGMVFDPADGLLKPIRADFRFFLRKYDGLYKVAGLDDPA